MIQQDRREGGGGLTQVMAECLRDYKSFQGWKVVGRSKRRSESTIVKEDFKG